MEEKPTVCPQCHNLILPGSNFCQTCGLQLHAVTQAVSIGRQIYIYAISLLLPPIGIIWTFKYFRSHNSQPKKVAYIALALTIISIVVSTWLTMGFLNNVNQQVQQQLSPYQNLGL